MVCVTKMCVCDKDVCERWCVCVWQSVGERWCGRRGAEEEEEAEEDNTGDADLKTRTPHNFVGKNSAFLHLGVRLVHLYIWRKVSENGVKRKEGPL